VEKRGGNKVPFGKFNRVNLGTDSFPQRFPAGIGDDCKP